MIFLFVHCPLPDRGFHKILFILPTDDCDRFDSASLCVGFEGIACFNALVINLEGVAVFFL